MKNTTFEMEEIRRRVEAYGKKLQDDARPDKLNPAWVEMKMNLYALLEEIDLKCDMALGEEDN